MLQPRHVAMVGGVRKVRAGHSVQRDSSRMGSWTHAQKLELIALVQDHNPCGAADWEVASLRLWPLCLVHCVMLMPVMHLIPAPVWFPHDQCPNHPAHCTESKTAWTSYCVSMTGT